ncbi:AAA family ATPase [Niveispirillum sp. BGYR6]|uniref:AAA family ATPase n=1 Tax=Niveispirillum sp. BGYR6 TaxID=2971249 RepID=UPI0022B9BBD4|nr:AAA family ATPase [Niveispirillum sp. BGYR6]MDG5497809.1 AAA family ATPase [Niveispirillum sp. BGYR6]
MVDMGTPVLHRNDLDYVKSVQDGVGRTMFGLEEVLRLLIVALYTGGHVLLEGNPGLGKTQLIKDLCANLGFDEKRWGRIQFTPDLMPADITGTKMPVDGDMGRFAFQPGPLFRWLLLADEINRATPKTQSAMLEAMAEGQVTVLGQTHKLRPPVPVTGMGDTLSVLPPFMVLATQNPIDQEGVFDLPEAQADRFMFKVRMPFPNAGTLGSIIDKVTGPPAAPAGPAATAAGKSWGEEDALRFFHRIGASIRALDPPPVVKDHIVNIVLATNHRAAEAVGIDQRTQEALEKWSRHFVDYGAGPRAATAMMLGAKGWAGLFLGGVDHAGAALGRVAMPVLRHRLKLVFDWEHRFLEKAQGRYKPVPPGRDERHDALLAELVMLTAPTEAGYRDLIGQSLRAAGVALPER